VVLGDGTDADVVGNAADDLLASVQVFHVRGGRVRGQRGWIVDVDTQVAGQGAGSAAGGGVDLGALVENFLLLFYGDRADDDGAAAVPREILVPVLPGANSLAGPVATEEADLTEWLSGLRGSRVSLRVPQRGDKRALAETVTRNAAEALTQHRLKRASDLTARSAALTELADTLGMDTPPLRIECIDISHVQGTDVVASLVVFEDGLPKRSDYRRFAIRDRPGDDVASIAEVVRRRFTHGAHRTSDGTEAGEATPSTSPTPDAPTPDAPTPDAPTPDARTPDAPTPEAADNGSLAGRVVLAPPPGINPETGRPRRFAYPPQLLVVDGGAPQVNAAATQLADLGIVDVTVCGLAKRLEEVWVPEQEDPIIFPRTSEALYLLQRLRDEAHRFAITYHRAKRSKSMTVSALDNVPGLGETRRKALVRHFGSVAGLRRAAVEDIMQVPGVGRRTAEAVAAALAPTGPAAPPAATADTAPRSARASQVPLPSTGTGVQS